MYLKFNFDSRRVGVKNFDLNYINTVFNSTEKRKSDGESEPKRKKLVKGCPFYSYQHLQKFRDHVLVSILEIKCL